MKIAVVGAGYVGLSIAVLLARKHNVALIDIDKKRVNQINHHVSPIRDAKIEQYLQKPLNLIASVDTTHLYENADAVVIATPSNYDSEKDYFDTGSVESVISQVVKRNPSALIVIMSTVPVGFTREMNEKYGTEKIVFCPEFLREGHALEDNLFSSHFNFGGDHTKKRINWKKCWNRHSL